MKSEKEVNREKTHAIEKLLLDEYVLVHVHCQAEGVILPSHLTTNQTVTLKLSKLFRGALEVKSDRVLAELLFGDNYFKCVIPHAAIWGITSYKGGNTIWPESAPTEVLKALVDASVAAQQEADKPKPLPDSVDEKTFEKKKAGHLKRVK